MSVTLKWSIVLINTCVREANSAFSMESQPQNPEFRNNPENFHPC